MNNSSETPTPLNYHDLDTAFFSGLPRKILLLEDNPDVSAPLIEYLEEQAFSVSVASNGVEGLKKVMAVDFDVILCDMLMPHLPGDMFYKAVERTKPHLCRRFIFMTAHKEDPRWSSFVSGIGGVMLEKPFQLKQLQERIEEILRRGAGG